MPSFWRKKITSTRRKIFRPFFLSLFCLNTAGIIICDALSNEISQPGIKIAPEFVEQIENITVTAGRVAVLSCVVENLGQYKVGWLKVDTQTILSLQKRVVTHNSRISVTHDEHRTWNLHIRHVKESDRGCYMCQINTPFMMNSVGCIEVYVPPNIIDNFTSPETTVNEGDDVFLICSAEGYPSPEVKWRREDKKPLRIYSSGRDYLQMEEVKGENLTLIGVTRKDMSAYLCIASNGVPPIVSKRINLNVNFAPQVRISNQLLGAPKGTTVEIKCEVEAYPAGVTYWEKVSGGKREMLMKEGKKKYHITEKTMGYSSITKLRITKFNESDDANYHCLTSNSLGNAETSINVYLMDTSPSTPTTEKSRLNRRPTPPTKTGKSFDQKKKEQMSKGTSGSMDPIGVYPNSDNSMDVGRRKEKQRANIGQNDLIHGQTDFSLFDSDYSQRVESTTLHYVIMFLLINWFELWM